MEVLTYATDINLLTVDTQPSVNLPDCVDDNFDIQQEHMERMKSEENRLATYTTWPSEAAQQPADLVRAGLFYTLTADRVQCPFCYGVLKQWLPSDNPYSEHAKHFPQCRFIRGLEVGNVPISPQFVHIPQQFQNFNNYVSISPEPVNTAPSYSTNIITARENRIYPANTSPTVEQNQVRPSLDLTRENNRLATYEDWPKSLRQQPDILARAGFYHIPCDEKPDRVKCAYCNGKLYNWQADDDPFMEHAKCFPTCPYISLCLGEDVMRDLQISSQSTSESVPQTSSPQSETHPTSQQSPNFRPFLSTPYEDTLEVRMRSEPVQAVLEMGFRDDLVKQTVETCLRERQGNFPPAEELASLVMQLEDREQNASTAAAAAPLTPLQGMIASGGKGASGSAGNTAVPNQDQVWRQYRDPSVSKKIKEENERLKDQYLCKVCMENQVRVTFMPCGHLACCGPCSVTMSECPICRARITGCIRTYF